MLGVESSSNPINLVLNVERSKGASRDSTPRTVRKTVLATAATQAASEGDIEKLEELLEQGLDLNLAGYDKRTPLHLACAEGKVEVVKWLVSKGAEISSRDRWGVTPLVEATKSGNREIQSVLQAAFTANITCQTWNSENDKANFMLLNDVTGVPGGVPSAMTGVADAGSKRKTYEWFSNYIKSKGIQIASVQDIALLFSTQPSFADFLVEQLNCIQSDTEDITAQEVIEFKKHIVDGMSVEQLAFAATNRITFKLSRSAEGALVASSYEIQPLLDILKSRLQLVTPKGVVFTGATEKQFNTKLLNFIFGKMNLPIVRFIPEPLKLNGGDYVPVGEELCFMGTGLCTDEAAVRYMLAKDVFGHRKIAVVRDLFDRSQTRKTLESVFKLVDKDCIIVLESILGKENLRRRLVDEYVKVGSKYEMVRMNVELGDYLEDQGFHVIEIPEDLYKDGFSIVNLGNSQLLVPDQEIADLIRSDNHFKGTVEVMPLEKDNFFNYEFVSRSTLMFRTPTREAHHTFPSVKESLSRVWGTTPVPAACQTTDTVLMIAPVGFQTNIETAVDNYFMKKVQESALEIEKKALLEFSALHKVLSSAGVRIVLFCSERFHKTPDAVFPNNWFSTHSAAELGESTVVFYPMKTVSRRNERRQNMISEMQSVYKREISFVQWENSDFPHFLESTGVLIMDRVRKIAYATLSQRCYSKIAHTWAHRLGYDLCLFHSTDIQGRAVYHTNVMMSVGTSVAVVCLDSVEDAEEKRKLVSTLKISHEIIPISREQMNNFCGNILELKSSDGKKLMCMSTRAYENFTDAQRRKLLKHVDQIVHSDIRTIETIGGGGVRCMMGELF
jgi:arginine deiminase